MKYLKKIKEGFIFFSDSTANFYIRGLSFKGCESRSEYFSGFFGVHLLLLLLLPFFLASGHILAFFFAVFCMFTTFFVSLSATCRRVTDAGGTWFLPMLPPLSYCLFCLLAYFFGDMFETYHLLVFFVLFSVLVAWNMFWILKKSKKERQDFKEKRP